MLCENCGKKEATSILLQPNNKINYLCGECYKSLNRDLELDNFASVQAELTQINLICKNCGQTLNELNNSLLFGCEECYKTFKNYIEKNVILINEKKYNGKIPNCHFVEQKIKSLEQMIETCLKNNNFEQATKFGKELEEIKGEKHGNF